ncbi:ethanolamine utilization protein EutL [Clostridium tetanomorphum]|uniref:Ethanolamine utilization microcompartment protein EutL n=1 Tax=Clostridium tetanomorphum TaxID=1553 RepID=A0A923EAM9_CLOTT|nr:MULTISPECIES: ethanolamine utilization microcompartment protein EutL [Clostridium]KAJ52573.1 ethanolamine utilization protein EutL [Clostridium tetanomorphum DSM 665]MBC2396873.1 ethanolamine utilization microcompartment protein EutL [Clostridium tetanomorphum]MBC2425538.1 ethanolamine utilization microcompartment protein EutL [Clostridium beijerinckii]MBP1863164.1 ethanolamine utilization protein EutL [Clostridium tetanomorphum]NRS84272.1 ethanolamine utilization protein EutL [Clostridium 
MKNDPIRAKVLSVKMIPNVDEDMVEAFKLQPHQRSLGLISADIDDVSYTALDEATKKADIEVVYARSMYGGSANANTKLAGEFIGIIAGPNPAEVRSGLNAAIDFIENDACFYSANDEDNIVYYAHCISRTGSYLSKVANIEEGEAIAYLIAPPLEAMYALDAALKAADVKMAAFYGPPSETNFGGGLLTGSQSACKAACDAFAAAVQYVAENPDKF